MGFFDQAGGYDPMTGMPWAEPQPAFPPAQGFGDQAPPAGPLSTSRDPAMPPMWGGDPSYLPSPERSQPQSPPPPSYGPLPQSGGPAAGSGRYPGGPSGGPPINPLSPALGQPATNDLRTPFGSNSLMADADNSGVWNPNMLSNLPPGMFSGSGGAPGGGPSVGTPPATPVSAGPPPGMSPGGGGGMMAGGPPGYEPNWLGKLVGVHSEQQARNSGQQMMSGLGAGLQSVGQNWNKPGLAALAGSAGSAMQGGEKERHYQQGYDINRQKAAAQAQLYGARADYYDRNQKFQKANQAWQNSEHGRSRLAEQNLAGDWQLKAAYSQMQQGWKTMSPEEQQKAKKEFEDLYKERRAIHYQQNGLDPNKADHYGTLGTEKNPHTPTGEADIQSLREGSVYKDPTTGKLKTRKGDAYNTKPEPMPAAIQAQAEDYAQPGYAQGE